MQSLKQFSPACERNQEPILAHLKTYLNKAVNVLEIGSGTGQHAVYFGRHLPHLRWQTSDRAENHPSIRAWINDDGDEKILAPLTLDVGSDEWPTQMYDAVFTANTCHIMHWAEVRHMFMKLSQILSAEGVFIIYGPFNYDGRFTSISNQEFDAALRAQAAHRAIRNIEDIQQLAAENALVLVDDLAMPAHNRLLVFAKSAS